MVGGSVALAFTAGATACARPDGPQRVSAQKMAA